MAITNCLQNFTTTPSPSSLSQLNQHSKFLFRVRVFAGKSILKKLSLIVKILLLEQEANKEIVLGLSAALFWDTDPQLVDLEKQALFIVERILTRGSWNEFHRILTYYGKEKVGSFACQIRCLDKKTFAFCASYFNIPKENFKCYTQQQLHQTHWNY